MYIAQETVVSHAPLPAGCLLPETDTDVPGNGSKRTGWLVCPGRPYPEYLTMNFGARDLVILIQVSQFPRLCTVCIG